MQKKNLEAMPLATPPSIGNVVDFEQMIRANAANKKCTTPPSICNVEDFDQMIRANNELPNLHAL